MDEDDNRVFVEIDRDGALFYILDAFIGAYNRRTDVLAQNGGSQESTDLDKIKASIDAADAELKG